MLTDAEIDELLSSFDQSFPSRLRAYAMMRCLIDLGLRSSEVVKLQLDDFNWADGTINLVGTKSRRADVLPLPSATGAAIAAYPHEERPPDVEPGHICSPRRPYDEPITTKSVKRAVLAGSIPTPSSPRPQPLVVHTAASHRTSIQSRRSATLWPPHRA
nr:tyrosine-type recombinase/integrase [Mesorhizobium silamurunense]